MNVRNPERILAVGLFVCLVSTVYTEIKAGHSIPRPRPIAAYVVMFGALGLVASLGGQAGRVAGATGGLLAFVAVVSGVVGKGIVELLNKTTGWLAGGSGKSSVGSAVSAGVGAIGGFSEFAAAARAPAATGSVPGAMSAPRPRP